MAGFRQEPESKSGTAVTISAYVAIKSHSYVNLHSSAAIGLLAGSVIIATVPYMEQAIGEHQQISCIYIRIDSICWC